MFWIRREDQLTAINLVKKKLVKTKCDVVLFPKQNKCDVFSLAKHGFLASQHQISLSLSLSA
jgi:hypothetical protein